MAADLVNAATTHAIRKRLLDGLVHDIGVDAAALWVPTGDHGLELRAHAGLPAEVAQAVTRWPADSVPDRLLRRRQDAAADIVSTHAPLEWGERTLYLVAIAEPAPELIGAFATGEANEQVVRLLVALGRTYAAAVNQTYVLNDNQRIIDAIVDELRPTDVELPAGWAIGSLYRSATAGVPIGGDLIDWFRTNRGDLGVAVGDVSGKGVQAASRTAMTVHSLRAFAQPGASPHVAATMLNTVVSGRASMESFVTLTYLRVTPDTAAIDFTLAGHPPPVLMGRDGVRALQVAADLPIGIDPGADFALHETALEPGETLLLYTDGVTEARAAGDGRLLGMSGLISMLERLRGSAAQDIADGVWQGVQDYTGGATTDDVAVLALQRD